MTFPLQWVTIDPLESYWRNFPLKKIYDAVDRFCARHPRFGIPDLMRWIVIGNVAVYVLMLLTMRADANALAFLYLDGGKVLRGEIWRIITFIFVPASSSPFWLAISLYFYYWIGTSLERQWGTARFNLYYWSGVLLTAIVTIVASAISGTGYPVGLSGERISLAGKILAVADNYDALICVHPHSEPLPPHLALARLRCLGGAAFDRDVLEHVIRCLGAYPVGSVVETDGGRRAVVVGNSPDTPLQPVVRPLRSFSEKAAGPDAFRVQRAERITTVFPLSGQWSWA